MRCPDPDRFVKGMILALEKEAKKRQTPRFSKAGIALVVYSYSLGFVLLIMGLVK